MQHYPVEQQATNQIHFLGRVQYFRIDGAQQAALDMQSKVSAKLTPQTATGNTTAPNTNNVSAAQKAASMLANAKIATQQSSVFAMLGVGGNSDSTNSSNQLTGLMAMLGNTVDTSA